VGIRIPVLAFGFLLAGACLAHITADLLDLDTLNKIVIGALFGPVSVVLGVWLGSRLFPEDLL